MRGRNSREWADITHRRRMVAQLDVAGHSASSIALMLNVCRKTIERDRAELKLSPPKAPLITAEELARAQQLLEEGCNYAEVGRTLKRSSHTLRRHLPGYTLDRFQIAELAANGRWMARLERTG